jgi:hypothetical protein
VITIPWPTKHCSLHILSLQLSCMRLNSWHALEFVCSNMQISSSMSGWQRVLWRLAHTARIILDHVSPIPAKEIYPGGALFHAILGISEVDGSAISYSIFLRPLYHISPTVQILALHTLATIFTVGITQQPIPCIVIHAVCIVFLISSPADLDIDKQHP